MEPQVLAAVVAAAAAILTSVFTLFATVVNTPLKFWIEKKALEAKLRIEYEQQQRVRIRDLISRYKGLALEAAELLDHRCWNLYRNDPDRWLEVEGNLAEHYYFRSWLYRLLRLLAIARAFEREALFIDPQFAQKEDFDFVHIMKSWTWAMTDVALFDGIQYDHSRQRDHIFRDELQGICEALWRDGQFVDRQQFRSILGDGQLLQPLSRFLQRLHRSETRLRWDRLVCLHLLVLRFLNEFGYETQRCTEAQLQEVCSQIQHDNIAANLSRWWKKLGVDHGTAGAQLANALLTLQQHSESAAAMHA